MAVCNLSELRALLKPGQGLLGLDSGSTVIGVAIADPGLSIASPLTGIVRRKLAQDAAILAAIIAERNIGGLVVGLPKNMDGSEGPSAQSARTFVANLFKTGVLAGETPVTLWDERLSTAAVERFMIAADISRKRRDETVDKAAAAYILQGALDALRKRHL